MQFLTRLCAAGAGFLLLLPLTVLAGPVADRVTQSGTVRVCIWPEYHAISYRSPRNQELSGIDIDLARAFAADIKAKLDFVDSSFATLVSDVSSDRCDVAMFAIAVTEARSRSLRFARPYLRSDIYGITLRASRTVRNWDDIDRPGVSVGVQAGTFMEPVMKEKLLKAQLVVIRPPLTRERELESGRIDVFMSDYPFSRRFLENADWARLIAPSKPFNVLPYAHAVKPGDDDWFQLLDRFVERASRDGRIASAAQRHGLAEILARQ